MQNITITTDLKALSAEETEINVYTVRSEGESGPLKVVVKMSFDTFSAVGEEI